MGLRVRVYHNDSVGRGVSLALGAQEPVEGLALAAPGGVRALKDARPRAAGKLFGPVFAVVRNNEYPIRSARITRRVEPLDRVRYVGLFVMRRDDYREPQGAAGVVHLLFEEIGGRA